MTSEQRVTLERRGFVRTVGPFGSLERAWSAAGELVDVAAASDDPLVVLGDFVIPPQDGPPSRDFQTLHFDFGLPLIPVAPADVARYTALHIAADTPPSDAVTRLIPLRALLAGMPWPDHEELVRRFAAYGSSHGAWGDADGYAEGSLARIVEAALGQPPVLPSVREHQDFLCGTEFASLAAETEFFAHRGLHLDAAAIEIRLRPGELLVFDNLALAHGRRGTRQPGELNQRIFGHPALPANEQIELRDRALANFAG